MVYHQSSPRGQSVSHEHTKMDLCVSFDVTEQKFTCVPHGTIGPSNNKLKRRS